MVNGSGPSPRARLRGVLWWLIGVIVLILAIDRLVAWQLDPRRSNPPGHVVLFSAEWCGLCTQIRQCLLRSGVPFEERDVEKSLKASAQWWTLRVRGVPATLVGPQLVYGFQTERLKTALAGAGHPVGCWEPDPAPVEPDAGTDV
ncbi:MAG: glutaredoxin [Panacagrimonas sp.]|jgi:glutaredoxin|nr:glutaredoxin family protein [Panacagrimonas sp.]MCC2656219.1 glutaredoxin [Panacagrimonas sp.]